MVFETPQLPENLAKALLELADTFTAMEVSYALIGGLGAGYRSLPRFTQDVDFVLNVPQIVLPGLLGELESGSLNLI